MNDKLLKVLVNALDATSAARRGDYMTAAGHAADIVLDLLPPGDAKKVLDERIFHRVQNEAALAEQLKFPNG